MTVWVIWTFVDSCATLSHVTLRHVTFRHATFRRASFCCASFCRAIFCRATYCRVISCRVTVCDRADCHASVCHVTVRHVTRICGYVISPCVEVKGIYVPDVTGIVLCWWNGRVHLSGPVLCHLEIWSVYATFPPRHVILPVVDVTPV